MKIFIILLVLIFNFADLFGQKKLIDFSVPHNWPIIHSEQVSNDGKYLCYTVGSLRGNYTKGPDIIDSIFTIQTVDASWRISVPGPFEELFFTQDSRRVIIKKPPDSLEVIDLATGNFRYFDNVASVKTPANGNGCWMAYQTFHDKNRWELWNLYTDRKETFRQVEDCRFRDDGRLFIVEQIDTVNGKMGTPTILIHKLNSGKTKIICHGFQMMNLTFDSIGNRLFFLAQIPGDDRINSLRYYVEGMDSAEVLVDSTTPGMNEFDLSLGDIWFRSNEKIFFHIQQKEKGEWTDKSQNSGPQVNIWNYLDDTFRNIQRNDWMLAATELSNSAENKVISLQREHDEPIDAKWISKDGNSILTLSNGIGDPNEYRWRSSASSDLYLISTSNGSRRLLKRRLIGYCDGFSPSGRYVIWYDDVERQWFTYDIKLGTTQEIATNIHASLFNEGDYPHFPNAVGIAGWLENDEAVLIYDRYDIWKIDPRGLKPPRNITQKYGEKNNVQFQYLDFSGGKPISSNDALVLSAFDLTSKVSGFFELKLGQDSYLKPLNWNSGALYYHRISTPILLGAANLVHPLKARYANVYLLRRMKATQYPNLIITTDFKNFKQITSLNPQRDYNWYTNELLHWRLPDGRLCEGLLYKPEDFDEHKKYPIIFYYYERSASALNFFVHPQLSNGVISIPWYTSNGYLVFIPDIYFRTGHPGESAYNSVMSATRYLAKFSWVDTKHMGLDGHSFGGWETYYLITRTPLFAAAASASGVSDLISNYGRYGGSTFRDRTYFESGQGRMGASPWERMGLYIENSPVFHADRVNTPLLIMHNKGDYVVPFQEGDAFYSDLCRLRKKVWLLSYDGEWHTISDPQNALDYSIRLSQFFDHYLKGKPAPFWMTRGVPRWLKGKDDGLGIDSSALGKNF